MDLMREKLAEIDVILERPEDCNEDKIAPSLIKLIKEAWFPIEKSGPQWLQTISCYYSLMAERTKALKALDVSVKISEFDFLLISKNPILDQEIEMLDWLTSLLARNPDLESWYDMSGSSSTGTTNPWEVWRPKGELIEGRRHQSSRSSSRVSNVNLPGFNSSSVPSRAYLIQISESGSHLKCVQVLAFCGANNWCRSDSST
ncbi:hypothetical protein FPCIR_5648 [Fusarium pseudocircinatum]|uniref:Uncharacterized protein n=1 Tax=Fusarium pseudocircinatum TaxID=56676 RepID=A0A8H5P9L4_9HYPO|nr:hypothetical protein FPCIR_5648 [Fusarium pseudocircinatum]